MERIRRGDLWTVAVPAFPTPPYAKCKSVGPLHKSQLKARIGHVPRSAWPAIEAGLCRVLGIRVE